MNFVEIYIIELEILYVDIVQVLLPAPRFQHTSYMYEMRTE